MKQTFITLSTEVKKLKSSSNFWCIEIDVCYDEENIKWNNFFAADRLHNYREMFFLLELVSVRGIVLLEYHKLV